MTFKEFISISEEASQTDKGLLGFPVSYYQRKPSDGQPFANVLGSISGIKPRSNSGANAGPAMGGSSPMMMKKKMKKN
jgi:hypothetical protein